MVSLGQYVVNCFVPSGSKPSLKCNRGEKYSCFSNFDDKPGAKKQVLDAEKLIEDEKKLRCEQHEPSKDRFYRNFNNPRIENLAKSRGAKTERNEKCFCRSSQTQFRSTTPRHVKKSLRLRRPFNENDQQHQQDNDFLCECGCSRNENKETVKNVSNSNSFGCGILPFFTKLFFSQNRSSNNESYGRCHSKNQHISNFIGTPFFTANSNTSIEHNDRNIFYVSTECAEEDMYEMSERKQNFSRNPHHHKDGCDNVSFEMEFLSSFERERTKSSGVVKENKENMTTYYCETSQKKESPSRKSCVGSNKDSIHPESSFKSCTAAVIIID